MAYICTAKRQQQMFSKSCEYGIKAIIYIATQSLEDVRVKIGDVAENTGTPEAFTAKILGSLTKHNIVSSIKGPRGGFEIDKSRMKNIMVSEIVAVLDGDAIYNGCALGLSNCSDVDPCPLHDSIVEVRNKLRKNLESTTVYDLATKLKSGKSILIR